MSFMPIALLTPLMLCMDLLLLQHVLTQMYVKAALHNE